MTHLHEMKQFWQLLDFIQCIESEVYNIAISAVTSQRNLMDITKVFLFNIPTSAMGVVK